MRLELKHISPYHPYKLMIMWDNGEAESYQKPLESLHSFLENPLGNSKHKPILRPLSDLIKVINTNSDQFCPIFKLQEIEQGNWDGEEFLPRELEGIQEYGIREGDSPVLYMEWIDKLRQTQSFSFKDGDFSRVWLRDKKRFGGLENLGVNNQRLLFEKMFEWHFDVFGLIEKGLAIDINTTTK